MKQPAAIALLLAAPNVLAQGGATQYPNKPVRLIVPFAPGATDIVARIVAKKLSDAWGQQFVIDHRPGAGGAVGTELTARATPDGYTLMLANPGPSVHSVLLRKNPTYTLDDFAPVIYIGYTPMVIAVHAKFAPNNAAELIAYAKARPGKISWGSAGLNSNPHIALEKLKSVTGVTITHVPYKGSGPAMTDVISGQIDAMFTTTITVTPHFNAGRVKVIGVAGAKRQALLPDTPTLAEQGIAGADTTTWLGLVTAAKTPRAIIEQLNTEANKALLSSDARQQLAQLGIEIEGGAPEKFAAVIKAEADSITRLLKAGIVRSE